MSLIVQPFPSGPFDTNAYILACPVTKEAAIVDPAPDSFGILIDYLQDNKLSLKQILLTHSHWDHIADVAPLKAKFAVPVLVHSLDAPNLEQPGADQLPCWIHIDGVKPDGLFEDKSLIRVGESTFEVIHTPGHTPGSVCFYSIGDKILLSGDTLFHNSIGNISFPTSQPEQMWPSLDKLARLPAETKVYPGHGPATTISKEEWLPRARQIFDR